jgi:hypothetical protein
MEAGCPEVGVPLTAFALVDGVTARLVHPAPLGGATCQIAECRAPVDVF